MKIRPLRNLVLVRRRESESVTKGGIIIPDVAKKQALEGEIVAIGPGIRTKDGTGLKPMDGLKVGDKVLFGKFSGTDVKPGVGALLMLPVDAIQGVFEE